MKQEPSCSVPLNFADLLAFRLARVSVQKPATVYVQYRKSGAVFCGTVLEATPGRNGLDWFRVSGPLGPCWVCHHNVRLCSGDGRCVCEPEPDQPLRSPAAPAARQREDAAGDAPLGNTGTTVEGHA